MGFKDSCRYFFLRIEWHRILVWIFFNKTIISQEIKIRFFFSRIQTKIFIKVLPLHIIVKYCCRSSTTYFWPETFNSILFPITVHTYCNYVFILSGYNNTLQNKAEVRRLWPKSVSFKHLCILKLKVLSRKILSSGKNNRKTRRILLNV